MTALDKLIELEKKRTQGKWDCSLSEHAEGLSYRLYKDEDADFVTAMANAAPLLLELWAGIKLVTQSKNEEDNADAWDAIHEALTNLEALP
jgi:hypothetical protein